MNMPWITLSRRSEIARSGHRGRLLVETINHTKEASFFPVFFIHPARERRKNACHFKIGHFQWLEKEIPDVLLW
jgi:hypothetical protein